MTTVDARPEPLAIVGIGCLFPKAAGTGFFWANVKSGTDCITEVPATHWNPDDYFDPDPKKPDMTYARRGGFLSAVEFNPLEFGIPPNDIEATDTTQLLGLVAAKQALTDAKVVLADAKNQGPKTTDRDRVSIILGVTGTLELVIPLGARLGHPKWKRAMRDAGVPADRIDDAAARIAESYVPWQENSFPGLLGNVVAGRIANKLDLGGTNCVVDAACASSLSAVHLAALELQAGRCDVAVTGGCDTFNDIFMHMCFSKTPALSPTGDAKPFDAGGDGTILGEGLGVVVLKRLSDAEAAGDTVYAVLKAVGSSSDGKGKAIYEPSAAGQKKALQRAYALAGVSPDTIELVEAHGTGTKVGDTVEVSALADVYGAHTERPRPWCAVGSVKSQIGHTKAAAGAASLIKAALALHNKVLPPTIKVKQPVEPLRAADSPFYVSTEARPWLPRSEHPRRAALSAFGFGGSNFHAVLEEHTPAKRDPDWDGQTEIVALSAQTPHALAAALAALPTEWDAFARAAESSRAQFDPKAECRLCFAAHRTHTDLPKLLDGAKQKLGAKPEAAWHTPEGAHYGRGPAKGTVAVLFPGQGSQYVGMLRDVACLFPEALEALATANGALSDRLSDRVFPPGTFEADRKKEHDRTLRDTRNAQPALGAVSFGAWRVLSERFGVKADAFAGHSYGELVALAAAGRYTEADLYSLSRVRGELMARTRTGDAGTMLAAHAGPDEIAQALGSRAAQVVVANRNAPKQTVLSGPTEAVSRAHEMLNAAGIKATKLAVAAAFHSPLVADAAGPFRAALGSVRFSAGRTPVYANTTAAAYPAETESAKDLLANQLAKPVAFVEQIRALHAGGARTFVEVGPGGVLTRLVEAILTDAPHECVALDGGGKRPGALDLAHVLARLAAGGRAVALSEWERGSKCRPAPVPAKRANAVAICGANWVQPRAPRPPLPPLEVGSPRAQSASALPRGSAMSPQDPGALAQALQLAQQTLAALQRMQEQTAALHKQFLDTQEASQRTLHALVEQQAALLTGAPLAPVAPLPPLPLAAPPKTVPVAPLAAPVQPAAAPQPPATQILSAALLPPMALAGKKIVREQVAPAADVVSVLLSVVSEKTGYPADSLDLSLSLDADLGVDSIKRVEILSALQEKLPNAPVVKPEHLGTLHTLKDVADFLSAGTAAAPAAPAEEPLARTQQVDSDQLALIRELNESTVGADVVSVLLSVVSEKTGYPADSLDLSLSLDADLGVDSIKRVEILSALQEKLPNAPVVKPEHLGTLHTLKDVADFLSAGGPPPTTVITMLAGGENLPTKPITPQMEIEPAAAPDTVRLSRAAPQLTESALAAGSGSVSRPVPREAATARQGAAFGSDRVDRSIPQVVDVDLTVQRSRLSVAAGGEFWVVADPGPLASAVAEQLAAHGFVPRAFGWGEAGSVAVPAGALSGLMLVAPVAPDPGSGLNRRAFDWLKLAAPKLRATARAGGAVLGTVARLDGAFGLLDLSPDADPTAGGLAGLLKTAKLEWPEVHCKALDLAPEVGDAPGAQGVVDELLCSGPAEVGIAPGHRSALELARTARRQSAQLIALGPTDVVLVTGGARGVTADVVVALAETYAPVLVLTGRTPLAPADPPHLAGLTGEAELKRAITDALGSRAGPRAVGDAYKQLLAQREIRATLERVKAAGAKVAYFAVDATDGPAVADLVQQVRARFGPITGLIHAAGVLADKRLEDLTGEQFDLVYSTKVDGLRGLLDLLAHDDLKLLVLFSSTTARLGRVGQAAYACANEVLNKTAQVEARRRPQCRTVAINWGPWDGGMVTPALKKVFESEGVGVIPPFEGAMFLIQELSAAGRAAEVVALAKPPARPAHGSGVLPVPASGAPAPVPAPGAAGDLSVAFERALDVASHPVLRAHVLDGLAVFPLALHTEWLAHAALHNNPGMQFHGFNDLRVTSGLKVEAGEHLPVRALAGKAVKQDKHFTVSVELRGARKGGRDQVYSRAEIVLVPALPAAPLADAPPPVVAVPYDVPKAYRELLFHGPDLQGIASVRGAAPLAFVGTAFPAPPPAEWFASPLRSAWVTDPLVLDSAFQMMILWTQGRYGTGSLPTFAGRYRQFRKAFPSDPVTVVIRVTRDDARFARADIDFLTADGQIVAQMQDYECIIEPNLSAAFRKNKLGK